MQHCTIEWNVACNKMEVESRCLFYSLNIKEWISRQWLVDLLCGWKTKQKTALVWFLKPDSCNALHRILAVILSLIPSYLLPKRTRRDAHSLSFSLRHLSKAERHTHTHTYAHTRTHTYTHTLTHTHTHDHTRTHTYQSSDEGMP